MEQFAETNVVSNVGLESVDSITPQDEPYLEGAKAASQGDLPVSIIGDGLFLWQMVVQIGGSERKCVCKVAASLNE